MEMKCPYCDAIGGLVATHRHMLVTHLDLVTTARDDASGKMEYALACPFCGLGYRRELRPRNRNPRFLEEFKAEIALVAFDQLLYHLLQEHPSEVDVDPAELRSIGE
jgi:hypothetical protein